MRGKVLYVRRKIFRNPDLGVSRFGSTGMGVGICRGDNIEAKPSRVSRGPKMKKGTPCRGRGMREGPEGCLWASPI